MRGARDTSQELASGLSVVMKLEDVKPLGFVLA